MDFSSTQVKLSNESASAAPNNPVWKSSGNRYIFNTGNSNGWRIGQESDLATGSYLCKGKHFFMSFTITLQVPTYIVYVLNIYMNKLSLGGSQSLPIKPEVWSEEGICGSSGSVQVQCTKISGKLLKRIILSHHILGQPKEIREHFFTQPK